MLVYGTDIHRSFSSAYHKVGSPYQVCKELELKDVENLFEEYSRGINFVTKYFRYYPETFKNTLFTLFLTTKILCRSKKISTIPKPLLFYISRLMFSN